MTILKLLWSKLNTMVIIWLITVGGFCAILWDKLQAPMTTNIVQHQYQYQNQSQWQATVILPNSIDGIRVEKFDMKWVNKKEGEWSIWNADHEWQPSFEDVNAKCMWWTAFQEMHSHGTIQVNCFIVDPKRVK
jgi:hypothetical protein